MDEPDEERIRALEARVRRVEQDAAAARVLAGGADRDVAEVRVELREFRGEMREFRNQNNRVLSAMRADLVDLRTEMNERFAQVDRNFLAVRGVLDAQAAGLARIIALLEDGGHT